MKEIRPYPVGKITLMRSILFALSQAGAELHQYNENEGVVLATIKRIRVGPIALLDQELRALVRDRDGSALLELTANETSKLFQMIARYVIEGSTVIRADAVTQWNAILNQEEDRRRREADRLRRQQSGGFLGRFTGGGKSEPPMLTAPSQAAPSGIGNAAPFADNLQIASNDATFASDYALRGAQ